MRTTRIIELASAAHALAIGLFLLSPKGAIVNKKTLSMLFVVVLAASAEGERSKEKTPKAGR